ncbi:hypothetical protein IEU95_11755 [Hoyosella rhizosphaerae]|uniref:Nitrilase n=1 Tax=Hoyosella rhizosphaerae TaxID=1755582 RepID=A0A916XDJ5_9ACTN|nr:nitrilase-related carbon-nitrogen hydrolase [Hoyosella rhizosphaerae]MBN4927508.1 hypothetical protein [Hoyosella rhizosphaerae]GGC63940.1 nitrilase [Hoyosella rhizosphaerae]
MRVGIAQIDADSLCDDLDANLEVLSSITAEAAERRIDLLVTPELMLTQYEPRLAARQAWRGSELRSKAANIAAAHQVGLVFSTPELDSQAVKPFITVTLCDRRGVRLLHHRKRVLFGDAERLRFGAGGEESGLANFDGFMVGLALCYEVEFPEVIRSLAMRGADLVCIPTALTASMPGQVSEQVTEVLVPARSVENQLFIAYSNYARPKFSGHSMVSGPLGVRTGAGHHAEIFYDDVTLAELKSSRALNTYLEDIP